MNETVSLTSQPARKLRKIKVIDPETGTIYEVTMTGDDTSTDGQIISWRSEKKNE
jgi:hypothetical protein